MAHLTRKDLERLLSRESLKAVALPKARVDADLGT